VISRRELLVGLLFAGPALLNMRAAADNGNGDLLHSFATLEHKHGGRLGVAILDSAGTKVISYRGSERFAHCSTFKFLAAAFVLTRIDRKEEKLTRRIVYSKDYLVTYSPTTEKHTGKDGLSVGELCEAALTLSDNSAANLLLDSFGGPAGLTAYARSLGDKVTRFDRRETKLNEATPGDPRDTSTPVAMVENIRKIILGNALSASSRKQLTAWILANKTGDKRLRAGLPKGWRVGDKTGTGDHNSTNDIAVIWPPGRPPIIVTAYYTESLAPISEREAVLAEVGRLVASHFSR